MKRIFAGLAAALLALLLAACNSSGVDLGSAAAAPPDVAVEAGDGSATLTFSAAPGVDYWIFLAPTNGAEITTGNWTTFVGARSVIKATSPQLVTGLANGTAYAFTMNGRQGNGPGGNGSPSITITPRLAGASWKTGAPLAGGDLYGSTFGGSFVAVGAGGRIFSSTDAKAWTAQQSPVGTDLRAAVYGGNYVAVGDAGQVLYSADAVTWTLAPAVTGSNLKGVTTTGGGTYVAVGSGGTIIVSSDGGNTWKTVASGTSRDLNAIGYGQIGVNAGFIAVGAGGTILTSVDTTTWTPAAQTTTADLYGVAYAAPLINSVSTLTLVAVGANGSILVSHDGSSWAMGSTGSSARLNAVSYNTRFVIVGDAGGALTSDDGGSHWTVQDTKSSGNLFALTHNFYGYLAVGAGGANLTGF